LSWQSWVHDPKLTDSSEVKASVKLRFKAKNGKLTVVIRWGRAACPWTGRGNRLQRGSRGVGRVSSFQSGRSHSWGCCVPCCRSLQLLQKAKNLQFKQLDGVIKTIDAQSNKREHTHLHRDGAGPPVSKLTIPLPV
jgi:hypothetical protein